MPEWYDWPLRLSCHRCPILTRDRCTLCGRYICGDHGYKYAYTGAVGWEIHCLGGCPRTTAQEARDDG